MPVQSPPIQRCISANGFFRRTGHSVLHLFLVPVAWAIILAYVTWPVYRRLRTLLGDRINLSALLMTLLLAGVFALPLLWTIAMVREEIPVPFSVLGGGISAFGLIGLFLGPIVIGVPLAVWREWVEEQAPMDADP